MDDFADRTIYELIESYTLFLEAMKDEYDILLNLINVIFSSCSIITKTEIIGRHYTAIECEVFPSFFEYQIYKIMEKYTYYNKIKTQLSIIEHINQRKIHGDLKLKSFIDSNSYIPEKYNLVFMYYDRNDDTIVIHFYGTYYRIKVEDKYKQDMLNLFEIR